MRVDDPHVLSFITQFIASVKALCLMTITRLCLPLNTYIGSARVSKHLPTSSHMCDWDLFCNEGSGERAMSTRGSADHHLAVYFYTNFFYSVNTTTEGIFQFSQF
jgi:hypothetical protein